MANGNIEALVINHKPINEVILKRLLLIFDRVFIVDPNENHYLIPKEVAKIDYGRMQITLMDYAILYNGSTYENIEKQLIDKFDYAYHKGIIRVIDLKALKFYEKYWLPLRLAYDFDTANKSLITLSEKLFEKNPNATIDEGVVRGMFIEPSGVKIYPKIPEVPVLFSEEEIRKYKYDIQSFSIIGKLDRSLAICGEYNLIPAFIDQTVAEIFIEKTKIAKNNLEEDLKSEFRKANDMELQEVQYLLYKITEKILPDEIICQIPIKELIIARNNTFHELSKLRRKLLNSIELLSNHEFDHDFVKGVNKYITKEFEPNLKAYYSQFYESITKFIGYQSTFTFGILGSAIGLIQSLAPLEIAFLSGISATVGSVITNLANYIVKKEKDKFKNSYNYFLNFRG
jgi:hypothetical protein